MPEKKSPISLEESRESCSSSISACLNGLGCPVSPSNSSDRPARKSANTSGLVICLFAQVLNVLGVWFHPSPGAYFLSLVFILFVAAYVFARMVTMRPEQ